MRKFLAPVLAITIAALFFAGAILARVLFVSSLSGMPESVEEKALATDDRPTVMWSVASSAYEDAKGYAYSLVTKKTTGPMEGFGGPGVVRFNQSTSLCDHDYRNVPFETDCDYDSVANVLVLTAYGMTGEEKWMRAYTIDLKDLGPFQSAAEGYLVPVAVSDDGTTIYLGRRVETESYVAGLWKLDVASGDVSEISYVREHDMYQYDINPSTKELIGVTFAPPEALGDPFTGPSEIFMVDLVTGIGKATDGAATGVFENPMFSADGSLYAFYESGPGADTGRTTVLTTEFGRSSEGWTIVGVARDWVGDTLVVDRDGNLFLYDLATETETRLTSETDAVVEYLGAVK